MGVNSKIGWTDDTWNPWEGCKKVSPGCKFCYMFRNAKWREMNPNIVRRTKPATFNAPLTKYKGPLIFTCSNSDFFIPEADDWRDEAWDIIRQTPRLTYQILTKRPENIIDRLPDDWGNGWPNVWLGVSVETQDYVWRMDILRDIQCELRFVSAEPLLGQIDLNLTGFDWVITGGESGEGNNWRPAKPEWFRYIRNQCFENDVLYFHKQNGGNRKINDVYGGRILDGTTYDAIPETRTIIQQPSLLDLLDK